MSLLTRLALVPLAALLLASPSANAQTRTAVSFSLDFRALGRHAAWYVALDKGYYRDAGLDVTIVPSQGTAQAIQSLESGLVQFAFSDVAGLVAARANGSTNAKMVAVIYQKAPYAVFSLASGANVTKPEQLQHLTIGSGAGSFTQKVIAAFMVQNGLDPSTVIYTNIDPAARVAMLTSDKVPAIETFIMSRPGIVKAAGSADQVRTFLFADHGFKLYSNGILAKDEYLKAHGDIVRAFIKASLLGWRATIADPAGAAAIVAKSVPGLDPEVARQEIDIVDDLVATPETRAAGLGTIDPQIMAASAKLILHSMADGKDMTAAEISDASFLPSPPIKP